MGFFDQFACIGFVYALTLHCYDKPTQLTAYIQEPSICIVLQQARQICSGGECCLFGAGQFMFCPVNLPMTLEIPQASESEPYLGISMKIDLAVAARVLAQLPKNFVKKAENPTAFGQWELADTLENAFARLLNLLATPNDIAFLAPLIQQEIYYRLLQSDQGEKLQPKQGKSVSDTAYQVGYESPSQFSREYSRYFGHSPKVDLKAA